MSLLMQAQQHIHILLGQNNNNHNKIKIKTSKQMVEETQHKTWWSSSLHFFKHVFYSKPDEVGMEILL